ncbi:hypothetical protein F5Y12DRAFT_580377 [Xylaria sp. FL1777]|nr:hypothetical protein F5Y12DRAFT_580377 [Xylaria sp. FL1777]
MAGDICAGTTRLGAKDLYLFCRGAMQVKKTSSEPSHESSEPTEPAALYRCSSVSSFSSTYSTSSTHSSSSTGSSSPDEGFPVIGILKKPRHRFRGGKLGGRQYSNDSQNGDEDSHDNDHEKEDELGEEEEEEEEEEGEGECCWEDEESECDVVFERHVTFNDPIATDIVSGAPVSPSSHSRIEWTALRARACLERMKKHDEGDWVDCEGEEEDGEGEAEEISGELQDTRKHEQENSEIGQGRADDDIEDSVHQVPEIVVYLAERK